MNDFKLFDDLALICGDLKSDWEKDGRRHKVLRIDEPADSPRLKDLVNLIEDKLGFLPSHSKVVPLEKRKESFGLMRKNVFTEEDLDASPLLQLRAMKFSIGSWLVPTEEELTNEAYIVKDDGRQRTKVDFGFLSPFPALGISESLMRNLEHRNLKAFKPMPIIVRGNSEQPRKPLWKIWSSVILPRSQTRLVTSEGEDKKPWNDFSEKWSDAYFDDFGCEPPILRYKKEEIAALSPFDVALTAEHTGSGRDRVFRTTIVSQKFRSVLKELKVKGVDYAPVNLS